MNIYFKLESNVDDTVTLWLLFIAILSIAKL